MTCVWFEMLSRIPSTGLRLHLCRGHVESCPRCRRESDACAAPPQLITADRLPPGLDLWPDVRRGIAGLCSEAASPEIVSAEARWSWRGAYAAAMLLLVFITGSLAFFLGRGMQPHAVPVEQRPVAQTRLCSAKIADRPARVFQVQSRNPDRTIFWIAKGEKRS